MLDLSSILAQHLIAYKKMGLLTRAHIWLLWVGVAYVTFLVSLTFEPVQRSLIYLHHVQWPLRADFQHPEKYGFAPGKVLPLRLSTSDGAILGAWQILPNDLYEEYIALNGVPKEGPLPIEVFDQAVLSDRHPTILYNHGNAASRAAGNRIRVGRHMSDLNFNFLVIDYRGFADSSRTPVPTERGLILDSRTAWDYLTNEKQIPADQIVIMGQSLGTGVSVGLVSQLSLEGKSPRAMILVAPFSSIPNLLKTYRLGFIPLLQPFKAFPWVIEKFLKLLKHNFDNLALIETIECPILVLHAENDPTIPPSHSSDLIRLLKSGDNKGESKVTRTDMGGWGSISRFKRKVKGRAAEVEVIHAEAIRGGHNNIGTSEVSISLIKAITVGQRE